MSYHADKLVDTWMDTLKDVSNDNTWRLIRGDIGWMISEKPDHFTWTREISSYWGIMMTRTYGGTFLRQTALMHTVHYPSNRHHKIHQPQNSCLHTDGSVQNCGISNANAQEILQSCAKALIHRYSHTSKAYFCGDQRVFPNGISYITKIVSSPKYQCCIFKYDPNIIDWVTIGSQFSATNLALAGFPLTNTLSESMPSRY